MREIFKDVTIAGRSFRVNKFDALTGSYIVYTIMTTVLPMMSEGDKANAEKVAAALPLIDKSTFEMIQKSCLRVCQEITMVNDVVVPVQVMLADGRWGVSGMEDDMMLVILLTVNALGYNLQSFFDESALKEFKLAGLTLPI